MLSKGFLSCLRGLFVPYIFNISATACGGRFLPTRRSRRHNRWTRFSPRAACLGRLGRMCAFAPPAAHIRVRFAAAASGGRVLVHTRLVYGDNMVMCVRTWCGTARSPPHLSPQSLVPELVPRIRVCIASAPSLRSCACEHVATHMSRRTSLSALLPVCRAVTRLHTCRAHRCPPCL
jgi:hypothetical protein